MTQPRGKDKHARVKPGAILRAAAMTGGKAEMPNFAIPDTPLPAQRSLPPTVHAARLEILRDGDDVQKIIAHCRCGERIEIDCDYAATGTLPGTADGAGTSSPPGAR